MAVRVRVSVTGVGGKSAQMTAVLNGGFETHGPSLLLPHRAAALVLERPDEGEPVIAEVAGGEAAFRQPGENVEVRVVAGDRSGPVTECAVLVSMQDREVLLSDSGIDAVGVKVESFGRGLWRFGDESGSRPSEAPEYWDPA